MRGIVSMSQSLIWGGGGGSCKVYLDTAKICHPIRVFALSAWNIHIPSEKKYHCFRRYNTFTCYLQLSRKPRPCSSQCAKTNWKPQETKQHHSTEWDRNGNQLDVLSSCNLKERDKCWPSPFLDATNSFDCEFRVLLITLCLTQRKNTSAF